MVLCASSNLVFTVMFWFSFFFSGQGDTIVSILTDLNGFLNYENREFLLAEEQEGTFV